jgi:hypothetical protein
VIPSCVAASAASGETTMAPRKIKRTTRAAKAKAPRKTMARRKKK